MRILYLLLLLFTIDFSDYSPLSTQRSKGATTDHVRGVYISLYSLPARSNSEFADYLQSQGINALVIDIKNSWGHTLFKSEIGELYHSELPGWHATNSLEDLLSVWSERGFYLIGRVVVFKDHQYVRAEPSSALKLEDGIKFRDRDSLFWVDPENREFWDYVVELSIEAADYGFDEIQLDYVRFPDVPKEFKRKKGEKSKAEVVGEFLEYAVKRLRKRSLAVSADVFGLVGSVPGDLNIGQNWETISSKVDVISPMIYPSHYPAGFRGMSVPDRFPYRTVTIALRESIKKNKRIYKRAKIRPWIQAFSAPWVRGYREYGPDEIRSQIRALHDAGIYQFLLWNPSSRYYLNGAIPENEIGESPPGS